MKTGEREADSLRSPLSMKFLFPKVEPVFCLDCSPPRVQSQPALGYRGRMFIGEG